MGFYYNSSSAALANALDRLPFHSMRINHLRVAGGTSGLATMVMVFVPVIVCCDCCCMDLSLSYVKKWYNITSSIRLTALLFVPHWHAPHR